MFNKSASEESGAGRAGRLRLILILAGAALGILLLLLGNGEFLSGDDEEAAQPEQPSPQEELAQYQSYLENRVRTLCESVSGVSGVTVAVTLSGNFEDIYATELVDGNEDEAGAGEQKEHEFGAEISRVDKHPVKVVGERDLPEGTKVHDSGWKVPETVGGDSNAPGLAPAWESESAKKIPADVLADLENKRKKAESASKDGKSEAEKPKEDKPKAKRKAEKPKEKPKEEDDKMKSPQKNLDSFTKSGASPMPSIRDLMKAADEGREFAYPSGFRPTGANFDGRIHPYQEMYRTVHIDREMPAMPDMDRVKRVRN